MALKAPLYDLHTSLETNNEVLSDAARIEVQSQLKDAQRYLVAIDIQIRHLHADIDKFRSIRKHNRALLDVYRTILAPHRRLPNEILSEIFVHCASDFTTIPPEREDLLWTLLRVCSRWRQVALGTPSLWERIKINYSGTRPKRLGHISLLKQLLLQTDYPFTLDIHSAKGVSRYAYGDPIKTLIIPNIRRLKGLTLDSSEVDIDPFFELPPATAKILEDVSICVAGQHYIPLGPVTVLQGAPRLRRVTLKVSHFHPNLYRLPWAQLSDLHLPDSDIHTDIGHAILSHCTSLESCTLRLKCNPVVATNPQWHPPFVLRCLSSLTVHVGKCNNYSRFFQRFSFPRLSSFELIDQGTFRAWDSALTPIILRSPFLRQVSLWLPVGRSDIEPLFERVSSIVELSIPCGHSIPKSTLAKVSRGELLPKLASLTCSIGRNGLSSHLDMIESRHVSKAHASCVAKSYVLYVGQDWRDAVGEFRLNTLREKGLNIAICRA